MSETVGLGRHALARRARVLAHLRTPLYRDGYALVLSSAITSLVGLGYWVVAARLYSAYAVGLGAALIYSMMFLAGVSQLNLVNVLLRWVPDAGRSVRRVVVASYAVSLVGAALACAAFVAGAARWSAALAFLGSSPGFWLWFTAAVMGWCVFVLQDSVLTGLHAAPWVPLENAAFSVAKLALLAAFAGLTPRYGIFASWTAALVVSIVPVNLFVFGRLIPRALRVAGDKTLSASRSQLGRYVAADYVGATAWLAATALLPVIVTQQSGATENAYFSLAWTVAFPLYLIPASTGAALVVHGVRDQAHLDAMARRVAWQTARLVVPAAVLLAIAAPYILPLFGDGYARRSATLLRLLALAAIPNVALALYVSVRRVERRLGAMMGALLAQSALALGCAVPLLHAAGIVGVGIGWLASVLIVVAAIGLARLRPRRARVTGLEAAS